MKICPQCGREYDLSMGFCLDDGSELLYGPASTDEPVTAILGARIPEAQPPTSPGGLSERHSLSAHRAAEPGDSASNRSAEPGDSASNRSAERGDRASNGSAEPGDSGSNRSAEPQDSAANRLAEPQARSTKLLVILGIGLLVLGAGFFGYRYFTWSSKQIESIAVMPFVNESGNADLDYLSDGMTETLIKSLSNIPNLSVKPRSSVFRYKGKDTDVQTIGKELNVQAILNGRVAQRGDQLTLSLELVDVQKDSVIWTEQYIRKRSDLVSLQSSIANDVLTNLKAKLSAADVAKAAKSYTTNSDAYQLYLKGRYHWNKRTYEDLTKAVDHFKSAIDRDDQFALAYSGLADTYSVLQYYQGSRSNEFINKAMPYAVRSVELDDQLAEAHSSLAFVNEGSWKWADAERGYQRALELNPNYSSALLRFARFEVRVPKDDEEGLTRIKRAVEIEPSSAVINDNLSQMYLSQGRFDLALEQAKKTVELDANFSFGWIDLAYAQLANGQKAGAQTSAEKAVEVTNRASRSLICLGFVSAVLGHRDEASAIRKELEQRYDDRQADAVDVAAVYAGIGDRDQVFVWLNKAFADHSSLLVDLRAEYPFAGLLDDPRFKDLRKRMNLPE